MSIELSQRMNFAYGVPRELTPGVARIVANNPSPLTFKGTNTYLVGTGTLAVIDPGPEDAEHCAAIVRAVAGRPVSHIVLTHAHGDHSEGVPALQAALGAPLAAYGYEPKGHAGKSRIAPDGREVGVRSLRPEIVLRDRHLIEGEGWRLEALFTPGHAPDHLCFALTGTGIVFSGDHVMAWNTSVVGPPEGRMSDYLASLERMRGRGDTLYLPGHGGKLAEPERMVRGYLIHRRMREEAILGAIRELPRSIGDIVGLIYPAIDPKLSRAAALSVQAHVEHLLQKGLVACDGPLTSDRQLFPA
jgi:glyoxylase-like metal-dependent hydrolase (beta-lactamase superfamily II)